MSENSNKGKTNIIIEDYLLSRKYDLNPIDCEHPLWQNISEKTKIYVEKNDENLVYDCVDTYLNFAGVVFDDDSYNFHIFPLNKDIYNGLSEEFRKLRNNIREKINDNKKFLNIAKLKGSGTGRFTLFQNVENAINEDDEKRLSEKNIYQYVAMEKDGAFYSINFMRYTCDENNMVGCTMRAIQFHKECIKGINKGKNENGKVVFDICYPNTADDGARSINSAGNVCYNPPVEWPNKQPFDTNATTYKFEEDLIKKIIDGFIYFIEKEGNVIDLINKEKIEKIKQK